MPRWLYNYAVYPAYVENIRDTEAVRDMILNQVARKPEPVAEIGKTKRQRHKIYGTRTG